jgi:DNA-binding NarL/FixJ family response regulator
MPPRHSAELASAAYDMAGSEQSWLATLAERALEPLAARSGVYAYSYRLGPPWTIALEGVSSCEASEGYWQALSSWGNRNTLGIAPLYRTQVWTLENALARARALGLPLCDPLPAFGSHGVRDLLIVMGQAGDRGVILTAPCSRPVSLAAGEHAALERLACELAVARRARTLRGRAVSLSQRERQVAEGLQRGLGDKAIAYGLGLSGSAVAAYMARLRLKLRCAPGEELLALAPAGAKTSAFRLELGPRLTPAEHHVACALVTGLSHAEIAHARGSSLFTVASQVASIFRKAGVSGRRELSARWFGVSRK